MSGEVKIGRKEQPVNHSRWLDSSTQPRGAGPVGQLTLKSAWMLGAGRVILIERVPERLALARAHSDIETIDFDQADDVYERSMEMTAGRGADSCIDAAGAQTHGWGSVDAVIDKAKAAVKLGTDRPPVLRQAIMSCCKGRTLSIPGVYVGLLDKVPFGTLMNKGLTIKTGRTHVQRYTAKLLGKILAEEIDPSFIITHRLDLEPAPEAYKTFRDKEDGGIKVVLKPN